MSGRVLVSACLLGEKVRYDGRNQRLDSTRLHRWQRAQKLVVFCPEVAAGLPIPRAPAEITPGHDGADVLAGRARVMTRDGADVTQAFLRGARSALAQARAGGCAYALLTDKSPSCGVHAVYGGAFDGVLKVGIGVTAALLAAHGIAVFAPQEITRLAALVDARPARSAG